MQKQIGMIEWLGNADKRIGRQSEIPLPRF
jgi:hypothetical protein